METLYAPWRMTYIKRDEVPNPDACIFCDKPREDNDASHYIVWRGKTCYAILNAFPYNNGHLMLVPYRHVSHITALTAEETTELFQAAAQMTQHLDTIYTPHGYNIGMNIGSAAGAGIAAHLHLHVVPRWNGDTNFMPVLAETKVLPEMLAQTVEKLTRAIRESKTD